MHPAMLRQSPSSTSLTYAAFSPSLSSLSVTVRPQTLSQRCCPQRLSTCLLGHVGLHSRRPDRTVTTTTPWRELRASATDPSPEREHPSSPSSPSSESAADVIHSASSPSSLKEDGVSNGAVEGEEEGETESSSTADGVPPGANKYSMRTRLREETEAPFRKARMFVLAGSAASASVGAFIAVLRIISAFVGTTGVQPLRETIPNAAIDTGVIALCLLLLRREARAGEKRLERMSRGARIARLRLQDIATRRVTQLKEFRGRKRVVIVAGAGAAVRAAVAGAAGERASLEAADVLVVPFVVPDAAKPAQGAREEAAEEEEVLAFERQWRLTPFAPQEWVTWFKAERDVVKKSLKKDADVFVIIIRMDGKVGARSIGPPQWPRLVEEVSRLPRKDQYGRP